MKLENLIEKSKKFIKENKSFCIASSLLMSTAVTESYFTIKGVNSGYSEWNPLIELSFFVYGSEKGLILSKTAICLPLIILSKYINKNHLLYAVATWQALATASWYYLINHG